MGRLIVTEFMTLDGVMEAPGFDEHRSGRNAWALRLSDDEMQVFNSDQLLAAEALLFGRTPTRSGPRSGRRCRTRRRSGGG